MTTITKEIIDALQQAERIDSVPVGNNRLFQVRLVTGRSWRELAWTPRNKFQTNAGVRYFKPICDGRVVVVPLNYIPPGVRVRVPLGKIEGYSDAKEQIVRITTGEVWSRARGEAWICTRGPR